MTEAELRRAVLAAAADVGLAVHSCRDNRLCDGTPGLPDLVIVGRKVLYAELKSAKGDTDAGQDFWYWALDRAGQMWQLWRPADWESGLIGDMLEAIR